MDSEEEMIWNGHGDTGTPQRRVVMMVIGWCLMLERTDVETGERWMAMIEGGDDPDHPGHGIGPGIGPGMDIGGTEAATDAGDNVIN
jgi:hypothetical protein